VAPIIWPTEYISCGCKFHSVYKPQIMKIGRQQTKCESVTDWLDNVSGQYHGDSNLQGGPKNISLLFLQACFLAHPVDISMVLTRDYRANLSQIHTFDAEDNVVFLSVVRLPVGLCVLVIACSTC